jgi:hypothetical protein
MLPKEGDAVGDDRKESDATRTATANSSQEDDVREAEGEFFACSEDTIPLILSLGGSPKESPLGWARREKVEWRGRHRCR